ncbi:YfiT family bacillithiol transferase [Flavobacterium pedocola]
MTTPFDLDALKFPIGHFTFPAEILPQQLELWKKTIASFPEQLKKTCDTLTPTELNWQYRPQGWKVKQVVHHLADSHMNALIRLKLSLTEDAPVIRPYEEALWAELHDSLSDDISTSLKMIESIHHRWSVLLEHFEEKEWNRMYFHPQHQKFFSLKEMLGLYDWHCRHHLAHIQQALNHKGNF